MTATDRRGTLSPWNEAMSYWIPSLILALVLLVLILQLPWSKPTSREESIPRKRNLGIPERLDAKEKGASKGSRKSAAS
jgi:hypothetical protein